MQNLAEYRKFLESKAPLAPMLGYEGPLTLNPNLKPHVKDVAEWMIRGGRRAAFLSYGLHKTSLQLQLGESLTDEFGGASLTVCPLGVRRVFIDESTDRGFKTAPVYVRTDQEFKDRYSDGRRMFLTNYERVRDGQIDPNLFTICSLDEASVLRSFGSKTYQTFLTLFDRVRFKFVATATPSPNRYKELIHYAGFLGVMDTGQALTRFFKRDPKKAGNLTLHPHKVEEFHLWLASWAVFVLTPSDLGYSDEGYILPPMKMIRHRLPVDHSTAGYDSWGQGKLVRDASTDLRSAAREKRDSLQQRISKAKEIIAANPGRQWIVWHDLEDERRAIEREIPGAETIYGSLDIDERENVVERFCDGDISVFGTKLSLSGSGSNFQHCWSNIFLGIGYKANDFMQALHRTQRYGQTHEVETHLIYTESEDPVYETLMDKIANHKRLQQKMSGIIREYGLNRIKIGDEMRRAIGIQRREVKGEGELFTCVNNDNVPEVAAMPDNSVDLIVSSWPFSDHYEYTESFNDFGHNDGDKGFFEQMEFLTPEIMRALKPGRLYCVHAKDRIVYGSVSGLGMYSVNRFSDKCCDHLERHGFIFAGRITVATDVVSENNQTYRLGYSENAKDGTKMGTGSPEYVLLFRKLPTDRSNSYADEPVVKNKPRVICYEHQFGSNDEKKVCAKCGAKKGSGPVEMDFKEGLRIIPGTGYSRGNWQFDAHSFWRSSGNRLMRPEELASIPMDQLRAMWQKHSRNNVYDFKEHVAIAEQMEARGVLPATYMALETTNPYSPWVWDDIVRMRTLNANQVNRGREVHICPLQIDIIERLIERFSQKGGLVMDPFGGIGSVASLAIKMERRAYSIELNSDYSDDAVSYCRAAEQKVMMPTLFDMLETQGVTA